MLRRSMVVVVAIVSAGCAAATGSAPMPSAPAGTPLTPSPAATTACQGPDADWAHIPEPVRGYSLAWNERDAAARRELLDGAWSGDGSYVDPTMDAPVVGRDALVELIGQFQVGIAGHYFEFREWTAGDLHHERARIQWRLCDADGTTVLEGEDIVELDPDTRIQRVTGFFPIP